VILRLVLGLLALAAGPFAAAADAVPWWTDAGPGSGIDFIHASGATGKLALPEIMGGGVAVFDANGDGRLDLYFTSGGRANRLYVQVEPWRFRDVTSKSGLGDTGYGMGCAVGDIDNDGDLDLYLANVGADRLFRNDGTGVFEEIGASAGVDVGGWSSSASFFDYDRDGDLDLYVTRYVRYAESKRCKDSAGRADYCSPRVFAPEPDVLLRNRGNGRFEAVSDSAGVRRAFGAGLGVATDDFNGDGWPDIFVANDGQANQLWINDGQGKFKDRSLLWGVAYNLDGEAEAGMGVVSADLDGDLDLDLFLTHLSSETNTFYRNLGGTAGFDDATGRVGLAATSLSFTGFGTAAFDVELDGDLDLAVANGRVAGGPRDGDDPWSRFAEPNQLLLNNGSGLFRPAAAIESPSGDADVARGLAAADIDNDGDLDLVWVGIEGRPRLFRNDAPREGHWLRLNVRDPALKRDAIGARVIAVGGDSRWLRTVGRGSSYLTSSDSRVHFGVGAVKTLDRVEVRWPDGMHERFEIDGLDRELTILRGHGKAIE